MTEAVKPILEYLPSKSFWLANFAFWLVLNTIAATNSYRVNVHFEREVEWLSVWLEYLPWWGNWAIIAPFIIATTQLISFDQKQMKSFIVKSFSIMVLVLCVYWLLTIIEVSLYRDGTVTLTGLASAIERLMLSPLHMDVLVYLAVFCSGYSYSYYKRNLVQKQEMEILSKQLIQVELQSLKSQLNPHFLFNTLNTIASLIRLDNKNKAIKALTELSYMLRKVLENQRKQFTPLIEEIEFIQSYLVIQKIRFEDKITIDFYVEESCHEVEVPCMLLQPLVENAVQHGTQLASTQNELKLYIAKNATALKVKLINKIPEKDEHEGFGLGLSSCKERLEKLYGDKFLLTLTPLEHGYFETYLSLPLEG